MQQPLTVTFDLESEAELEDLYTALVRARAAELSEMRSHGIQATVYHDRSRAGWQGTEADRAAARWQVLDRAVAAVAAQRRA
jgi:hypothetical protein